MSQLDSRFKFHPAVIVRLSWLAGIPKDLSIVMALGVFKTSFLTLLLDRLCMCLI